MDALDGCLWNMEKKLDRNYTIILHVLKATPQKTTFLHHLPLISQTILVRQTRRGALLEKQGWTHNRCSSVDSYTWTHQYWSTSKNLHQLCVDTRCSLEDLSGMMYDRDRWWETRDTSCCQCDLMIMLFICLYIDNLIIFHQMSILLYLWSSTCFDPISTKLLGIFSAMSGKVLSYIRRSG